MGAINKGGLLPVKGRQPDVIECSLRVNSTIYKGSVLRQMVIATGPSYALMSSGNSYPAVVSCEYTTSRATQGDVTFMAWRIDNYDTIWEGLTDTSDYYATTIQERRGDKCDIAIQTSNFRINADAHLQSLLSIYDVAPGQTGTAPKRVWVKWTATAVTREKV